MADVVLAPANGSLSAVISDLENQLSGLFAEPRRGAEIMAGSLLGWSRSDLYARWNHELTGDQLKILASWVDRRRTTMEPLQYITGSESFRTLDLAVGPGVLVPRPETEIVVERCLSLVEPVHKPTVVDIGTGSGAIALSLAVERPDAAVWATELSEAAAGWAFRNIARRNSSNMTLLKGNLFGPLPAQLRGKVDLIVSNPPYLSTQEFEGTAPEVRNHEPREALEAGPTGLEIFQPLVAEAGEWLRPGGWLVLEISESLWARLRTLLIGAGFNRVDAHQDLTGRIRIAEGQRP